MRIAIVGAGIAGLSAALRLQDRHDVTVFEKSRGLGGRVATRYAGDYEFDHGAQYFSPKNDAFSDQITELRTLGIVREWDGVFGRIIDGRFVPEPLDKARYVPERQMNLLPKYLGGRLNVKLSTHIVSMDPHDSVWMVEDQSNNKHGPFDIVICAIPFPQVQAILIASNLSPLISLPRVVMQACFSLMIGGPSSILPPFDGATVSDSSIGWIAANSRKPGRKTKASLMIQSTADWADAHIDHDSTWVAEQLIKDYARFVGIHLDDAPHRVLHRWRFAFVKRPMGRPFWQAGDMPFFTIGDWCLGSTIEDAFTSGNALSDHLQSVLPQSSVSA